MRLILNLIFFLASLLCVFVAPTFRLWIFAILFSEFSLGFVVVSALLLTWSVSKKKFKVVNISLATVSLILFSLPLILSYRIGRTLPSELTANFGGTVQQGNAFSFKKIFSINTSVPYETISYSEIDGETLTLDYYAAEKKGRRPCVIVIHGGSWYGGTSQQLPDLNSKLAQHGYQVASINYRLAPKHIAPAPTEDIGNAIKYLKNHSRELKIDTNNFILLGRSAGAQLALVAAYSLPVENIRGVVNFYGPTDMIWGYFAPSNPWIMDSKKVMEDYLGGTFNAVPQNYLANSPVELISRKKRNIPVLSIHGKNDALVSYEHAIRIEKKLGAIDAPHYLLSLPWATHGCDYTLNGPSGQLTTYAVEYFAAQVVKPVDVDIRMSSSKISERHEDSVISGSSGN